MTDVYCPEKRSAVMRRVKGAGTTPALAARAREWLSGNHGPQAFGERQDRRRKGRPSDHAVVGENAHDQQQERDDGDAPPGSTGLEPPADPHRERGYVI